MGLGVRMDQYTQRASVYNKPGYEGAELGGREEVHLEHGDWVWTDRFIPEGVDAEFGDFYSISIEVGLR